MESGKFAAEFTKWKREGNQEPAYVYYLPRPQQFDEYFTEILLPIFQAAGPLFCNFRLHIVGVTDFQIQYILSQLQVPTTQKSTTKKYTTQKSTTQKSQSLESISQKLNQDYTFRLNYFKIDDANLEILQHRNDSSNTIRLSSEANSSIIV